MGYILGVSAMGYILAGCASPAPKTPIQPVSIKADSFCSVMRRLYPPDGISTWDTVDSAETIEHNRRLEAAVAKKCGVKRANDKP
jgi:hypothetical protein